MKSLAIAVLLSSCAISQNAAPDAACGPQNVTFKVIRDKTQHPTPAPQTGKAMVYVLGVGTLAVDGNLIGAVDGNGTYFFTELDSGEHHLCERFPGRLPGPLGLPIIKINYSALHSLDAKSGETYYLRLRLNFRDYGFTLEVLAPDEGKLFLASSTFSTSNPK